MDARDLYGNKDNGEEMDAHNPLKADTEDRNNKDLPLPNTNKGDGETDELKEDEYNDNREEDASDGKEEEWVDPDYKCLEGLDEQTIFDICLRMFKKDGPSDHKMSDNDEVAEVPKVTP